MNLHKFDRRVMMAEAGGAAGGGAGGGNAPVFTYGDAHKDYVTTKGWKGVDDVITSNKNLETLLGADKANRAVIWPKDATDAEGWKAINAKLGVPEKPEAYELPLYNGATEPDAFQKGLAVELHKNGVPKAAAQALAKWVNDQDAKTLADSQAAATTKATADMAALSAEWGTANAANTGLAVTLMGHMGFSQEEIKFMSGQADIMRKFHKGAAALGTKPALAGEGTGNAGITKEQAIAQLEDARTKRSKNEITDQQWYEIMNRLSPIANAA